VHRIGIWQSQLIHGQTDDFHHLERTDLALNKFVTLTFDVYQFKQMRVNENLISYFQFRRSSSFVELECLSVSTALDGIPCSISMC
jgi:hypothetical protein